MSSRLRHLGLPGTWLVSGLAALTTWVTLLAWTPFSERSSSYMVPLAGAALVVAATGALLRATRLPALVVLLLQILVVAGWLHHRWAGAEAWGGWLPTGDSLALTGSVLSEAAEVARAFAAPVPASVEGFAPLLIVAGAATLLVVDFIACGLRRAPVAGLPLLAAYTAPISILDGGVPWLKFALGALCFLALIAAQEAARLGSWGRQVSGGPLFDTQTTEVSSQAVWSSARKIGVTATGLAVVVPLLVPTLSIGFFEGFGNGPGGNGDSVSLSNPMTDMQRDLNRPVDLDLLRVTTDDPDPSYLRVTVLDSFDGEAWRPSKRDVPETQRAEGLVSQAPGLGPGVERETFPWRVDVNPEFRSRWLPTPYPVTSINAAGDWRYDRRTLDFISMARDQDTAGLSYSLEAQRLMPTAEQLADAGPAPATVFGDMTELPELPRSVSALAREITAAAPTKFEQAVALQQWFRVDGGFVYSTDRAPGNGLAELERFLLDGKTGYCEQFATAMAVLGRSLAIPSRVAVGFLRPERAEAGTYVYSSHDLHAWPEMYFDGVGWVRFEPTPGIRATAVPGYTRQVVNPTDPANPTTSTAPLPSQQNRIDQPSASAAAGSGSGGAGGNLTGLLVGLGVALVAGLLTLLPRTVRSWLRRRRWEAATSPALLAEASWAEVRDTAVDLGIVWDDSVSVRRRARDLVRSFGMPGGGEDALTRAEARGPDANPEAARSLERLVRLVEMARYAREVPPSSAEVAAARDDVDACVAALRAGANRQRRTRATWLPASLTARWRAQDLARRRRAGLRLDEPGVDHAI